MDLAAPFEGTLLIPEKILPGESPVMIDDGEVVAKIRRPMFAIRHAFDILDAAGNIVGRGGSTGFFRRRWPVRGVDGSVLLELSVTWRGTSGRSSVVLCTGEDLTLQGSWWNSRNYTVTLGTEDVARISPTTHALSPWNDSYAFTMVRPVLSIVQAIGLAQSIRAEAQEGRRATQRANTAAH